MSRIQGAPPVGWRPTVKGKQGPDLFPPASAGGTVVLPDAASALSGGYYTSTSSLTAKLKTHSPPLASDATKHDVPTDRSYLADSFRPVREGSAVDAAAGYNSQSSASSSRQPESAGLKQALRSRLPDANSSWNKLFEELDQDAQPAVSSKAVPGGSGPDWDRLFNGIEGDRQSGSSRGAAKFAEHQKGNGDHLDYAGVFGQTSSTAQDDEDDDLPDLISVGAGGVSRVGDHHNQSRRPTSQSTDYSRNRDEDEDADCASSPPPQRLVFDLDSHLVDLASAWLKHGLLGHFNLTGRTSEGVKAWGEKLIPKGVLSLDDFSGHRVELDLSDTNVVATGFDRLEEFSTCIKRDGAVTTLRLARAKIGNAGASWIGGALMRNNALTELVLSGNGIGDDGIDPLAAVLDTNTRLRILDLSENRIGSRGALQLISGIARNRTLAELSLSRNSIGDEAMEGFMRVVDVAERRTSALRTLDLSGNDFSRRMEEKFIALFQRGGTVLTDLRVSKAGAGKPKQEIEDGKLELFTVIITSRGIEVRAGRAGKRAQVSWDQDQGDVEVVLKRSEFRKSDTRSVAVQFGIRRLTVSVHDELIMDIELFGRIRPDDCAWNVGDGFLQVVLAKAEAFRWLELTAA